MFLKILIIILIVNFYPNLINIHGSLVTIYHKQLSLFFCRICSDSLNLDLYKMFCFLFAQAKPSARLCVIYLIDSIIKNLPNSRYPQSFVQNIVSTFVGVFEKVRNIQLLYNIVHENFFFTYNCIQFQPCFVNATIFLQPEPKQCNMHDEFLRWLCLMFWIMCILHILK